jgi:exodeoxyribonuclease-5
MRAEDDDEFCVTADYKCLATGQKTLDPKQEYIMNSNKRYPNAPYEFVYGYGITTWKAQGSEWDKVLAFEEDFPYDKETHQKFLYTTITRAKNKLVLVKK